MGICLYNLLLYNTGIHVLHFVRVFASAPDLHEISSAEGLRQYKNSQYAVQLRTKKQNVTQIIKIFFDFLLSIGNVQLFDVNREFFN